MQALLLLECVALALLFLTSKDAFPAGSLASPVYHRRGGLDLGGPLPAFLPRRQQTQIERWLNFALRRTNRFLTRLGFSPLRIDDGSASANMRLTWGANGFRTVPE
ncbi:uncharacterized protein LOC119445686 [Dermacentor silvarum]|uniref:uncharacterized protein LOC119445686 n=1 Tax=Dermacentor silvarum TaxID=543639 RepID=UPI00189C2697|nr:uncharacterized protein LOC119445686 [Dermacentor silvarum]